MHETGVLTAIFPELEEIECLVVRDFYHRYTVDEHTLVAMENLWNAPAAPYRELLTEIDSPAVLLFALLFHDSGKGARRIPRGRRPRDSPRRRWRASACRSRSRDGRVPDPPSPGPLLRHAVARPVRPADRPRLAHQVGTVERLKALTLLTYADISAVNPNVMTPWRAEQLWQLYLMVYNELTRELESERIEHRLPERLSRRLSHALSAHALARTRSSAHMALEVASRKRGVAVESAAPGCGVADDAGRARPSWTVRRRGRHALQFRHEHPARRGIRQPARPGAGHVHFEDPHRTLDLNPTEVDRLRGDRRTRDLR